MKKITIPHIIIPVILLGIFFIPFNSWSGLGFLGEYYRDSCFLFFTLAFILTLFKKKIEIPYQNIIFQFLLLLLAWCLVATILNSSNVTNYFFKQTSGFLRFINQFGALIIAGILLPLTFFNGFKNYNLNKLLRLIRKAVLLSLMVVSIYAFIEVLIVKFGMVDLKIKVLNIFDYFPFTEAKIDSDK